MASPNSTFTELVSTTFRKHRKEIADNLSTRNALLKYMMKRGNKRTEDGGLSIVTPLDYAANGTYQRYSDWDLLNVGASDVISAAEYTWCQIAMNVVSSGRELRINSGDSRIINLAKAKIKNAIRTFNNSFCSDLYSAGSLTNQIGGLQKIIADTNTNTVGGIDASTTPNAFWRNNVTSAATLSVTPSATIIENGLMPTCTSSTRTTLNWWSMPMRTWRSWTKCVRSIRTVRWSRSCGWAIWFARTAPSRAWSRLKGYTT